MTNEDVGGETGDWRFPVAMYIIVHVCYTNIYLFIYFLSIYLFIYLFILLFIEAYIYERIMCEDFVFRVIYDLIFLCVLTGAGINHFLNLKLCTKSEIYEIIAVATFIICSPFQTDCAIGKRILR